MRKLFIMLGIVAFTASAYGASLTSIGVLSESSPESAVLAITPSGEYAVGYSKNYNLAETAYIQQPIIWSVNDGLLELPNVDNLDAQATGVVIRPLTGQIGIAGNIGTYGHPDVDHMMKWYGASLADLQTPLTFPAWMENAIGIGGRIGPYNTARLARGYEPPTYLDPWFIAGDRSGVRDFIQGVDGVASFDHGSTRGDDCASHSVSSIKYSAGYDHGNPGEAHRALYLCWTNQLDQDAIPGGSGVASEAIGISADSTVLCGYDTDSGGSTTQAFVWMPGPRRRYYWDPSSYPDMTLLGRLDGHTDSIGITCNLVGSDTIVAGSSTGAVEEAVVWDTTGIWDSTGQTKRLTDILTAAGVDCSDWNRLTRATTMSDSGTVIAGYGEWAADGSKRGFIAAMSLRPKVTSAVSIKTHGAAGDFTIDVLDRTNNADIECRKYGVTKLIVGFDADIQGVMGLDYLDVALAPTGVVNNVTLSASNELTIDISNTTSGVPLIVTFPGIADAADANAICTDSICIRQLVGDAIPDEAVTQADKDYVISRDSQPVTASNFRADIRADGLINIIDQIDTQNALGKTFSGTCVSCDPPMVASAVSVKNHGAAGDFGIDVGNGEIECRDNGIEQLVVGFDQDVQLLSGDSSVAIDSGTISSVTLTASNEVMILMSGTTNAVPLAITFPGVACAGDAGVVSADSVCVLQLVGDTAPDGVLTALDRVKVRDAMGSPVDASNFRMDVATDGIFTALDRVKVRDAMGTGLIGSCP